MATLKTTQILVVDDEADIRELVSFNLKKAGYDILTAANGEDALRIARDEKPELIVLDLMLPGIDGLDVCRILKHDARTESIRILMLTAKGEETDIVRGLEIGADDYVTKPFSPSVLVARVKAALRRAVGSGSSGGIIEGDELYIHQGRREVRVSGKQVDLTNTEFQILFFIASNPNWVFTRSQIIEAIRGDNYPVTERSVDFQIVGLRKKLGSVGNRVQTVRGVGYRFVSQQEE